MDYYGYVGSVLLVNLSSGEISKEPLDIQAAKNFIGGFGYNNKLAYDIITPGVDPLSAENPIVLGAGPLIGTLTPGASRIVATTKFPLTNAIGAASGSMNFGSMLKWAGYDHLVITGQASEPVYLKIIDDDITICNARHIWGKTIHQTTDELKSEPGKCSVIAIGQAGENLVKFSLSLVDKMATLGRGGLGAVMGAKNLKAIVVRGSTRGVKVADSKRFLKVINSLYERVRKYPLHEHFINLGMMAAWDNYANTWFAHPALTREQVSELYGPKVYEKVKKDRRACPSCFICDKDIIEVKEGKYAGLELHTTSYLNSATFILLYSLSTDNDYTKAVKLLELLDGYGLDQMTFCRLAAFLTDLYERGIITKKDTDGLELKRDADTLQNLIEKITHREGFLGNTLAGGWLEIIKKIGKDLAKYAPIVKGKDFILDPRITRLGTMEFEPVVCPRGPTSATAGSPTYPGARPDSFKRHFERMGASKEAIDRILDSPLGFNVARLSRYSEDWYSVLNSLGICNRAQNNRFYHIDICAELYSAATGIELSSEELMKSAERSWNMYKVINVREGFTRKDDVFPECWFEPLKVGDKEFRLTDYYGIKTLSRDDVYQLLDDYYDERGWSVKTGIPTKAKLEDLGLNEVIDDLDKSGYLTP